MLFADAYRDKRVLITGHTGFKGAWLAEWLLALGASVSGLALPPPAGCSLFNHLGLAHRLHHRIGDVRDLATVRRSVEEAHPDFIFHLAAQPVVSLSYACPVATYATNTLGTVHVLEAVRLAKRPCVLIVVTSDKCYENREWTHAYRENDPLGGHDPYSASKAAAEIAVSSYRDSYFSGAGSPVRVASARAGNAIGGGDWASSRIVPDCIRSLREGRPISVRNKDSTRPWQHVLEPLSGYLHLGAALERDRSLDTAFNFGPAVASNRTVGELVREILSHWPGTWEDRDDPGAPHEAGRLSLSTDKAFQELKWFPLWNFAETVANTVQWYRRCLAQPEVAREVTFAQIAAYAEMAIALKAGWTLSS